MKNNIPLLRFPEFKDCGEWEEKVLGSLCSMQSGKFISASSIFEKKTEDSYPCYGGNGQRGYVKEYSHDGEFSLIGRQGALCGNITFVSGKFYATEHALVVTPYQNADNNYLYYVLNLLNLNQYATGQAQPGLSVVNLEKVKSTVSSDKNEQQKIADCLSSLDALINAQSEKIENLKFHKKGLLQKLFPQEGQSVPEFRFPEFRDCGEWEEKTLGEISTKVGSGITPTGGDKNYRSSGRVFIRSQNVGWGYLLLDDVVYITEEVHATFIGTELKSDDILLNITGASIGRCSLATKVVEGGNVNQHVCIIRTNGLCASAKYISQFILSEKGQKQIDTFQGGGNRQGLNFSQIRSFLIPYPKLPEQQKIADCLSSLDEVIDKHSQKLELLKAHKKGLMQGLFPCEG